MLQQDTNVLYAERILMGKPQIAISNYVQIQTAAKKPDQRKFNDLYIIAVRNINRLSHVIEKLNEV